MDTTTALTLPRPPRYRVRLAVVLLALATMVATLMAPAPAEAASAGSVDAGDERTFLELVNRERTSRGLRALNLSSDARAVARDWSHTMAADDTLKHRPGLGDAFTGSWTTLGENVGVGWSVSSLHKAFMNSPGHKANVLKSSYRWVGVGSVTMSSGKIWVTFNFGAGDDTVADRFLSVTSVLNSNGPFRDVASTHTFAGDIEWLASSGITKGCNPPHNTRFCPDQPVTRAQMAAFLDRALPLPAGSNTFRDVPNRSTFASNIGALAAAGVTKGCNPPHNTLFCPDQPVTRAQMAAFLHRAPIPN